MSCVLPNASLLVLLVRGFLLIQIISFVLSAPSQTADNREAVSHYFWHGSAHGTLSHTLKVCEPTRRCSATYKALMPIFTHSGGNRARSDLWGFKRKPAD